MSIDPSQVAPVVVTRGDQPLGQVVTSLSGVGFADGYFWNNGGGDEDLGVYGRYAAIERVDAQVIYVQDDDCVLPPASIQALLDSYEPGVLVANLPAKFHERYRDRGTCMVGFGAIFDRDLPRRAFDRFLYEDVTEQVWNKQGTMYGEAVVDRRRRVTGVSWNAFLRTCDLVFAGLTPHKTLDLPYEDLPWARDESRMWRQPGHFEERLAMMNLVRAVRDGVTA